jgi:hypothetical protein
LNKDFPIALALSVPALSGLGVVKMWTEERTEMSGIIPAVYERGIFRPLEQPAGLAERQQVQLYFVADKMRTPAPISLEANLRFVRETMGIWHVADGEFRHWLAEEASLFDENDYEVGQTA